LRELAKNNSGLCLVTTREPLTDLQRYQDAVLEKDLEQISPEAGRALLRVAGIRGSDAELEAASCAFGNHALALNLLAAYLVGFTDQHIRNAAAIPDLDIPEQEGRHARRLMAALAQRLGDGPELNILRIMGLFEGPVTPAEIRCFRRQSPIKGLSDRLLFIKEDLWQQTLATLRSNRLLAPASRHAPEMLDAHPFVRDHFGREFGQFNPAAWQEAHSRLYEFYKKQAPDLPETLEEMEPLFAAVAHGCKADRHKDALEEIYIRRIQRDCSIDFCCTQLGAFNADLAALRNFFTAPWNRLPPTEPYKAFTIATLGFRLQGIGLFREAIKPMQTGFKAAITNNDWSNAARAAGNLSRIHSALGDLPQADIIAHEGVKLADRSKSSNERRDNRIILATVLLQKGQFAKATNLFSKAEAMQRIKMPQRLLFSVQGYNYCDLLLIQGKAEEVLVRTKQSLQMTTLYQAPLFIGLDHLNLGRSFLMLAEEEKANNVTEAAHHLNEAVDRLRQAGQIDFLPLALLAQAQLHRFTGEFDKAQQDLEEVFEIAEPEMRLHLTDYHLESARLALAMGDPANAQPHYLAAKDLISATGYHRRDKELADIRKQLAIA
ncbi:MAG: hypothetical protein OEV91_11930, partial [Desulfobulbaceae bacterium]|nr:hypothetical protein [Desulfobulbaceae bacterium]